MKFIALKEHQRVCLAWASSLINEAGTIFFEQVSSLRGNYPWLPHHDPVDNLKYILKTFTLDPVWETYGCYISKADFTHLDPKTLERLNEYGDSPLNKVDGHWTISLHFDNLSCSVTLHTCDLELVEELRKLICENIDSQQYKDAMRKKSISKNGTPNHVYLNESKKCLFVASDKNHAQAQGHEVAINREKQWIEYAFKDAKYLGLRSAVNLSKEIQAIQ